VADPFKPTAAPLNRSNHTQEQRDYVVVLRGSSSVRFRHGSGARLQLNAEGGTAEVLTVTDWKDEGLAHPVPRELWFEVRLPHHSIDGAIEEARAIASALVAIVSFATNAEIGQMEPHVAYDNSRGATERDFVEYHIPDESGLVSPGREADANSVVAVAAAVLTSPYRQAVTTALAHYHSALSYYFLGGEALAVGHLFMAAEALREPTLAAYCTESGRSEQDIMEAEGHENRHHLLAWARREILFAGDLTTYKTVKDVSDALEHGYKSVGEIRAVSSRVCDRAFEVIRRGIVALINLDDETKNRLLDDFSKPADTQSLRKRVRGLLIGGADELAAPDRAYPILEWRSRLASFDIGDDGTPNARFNENFTIRIAEGLQFQALAIELLGRTPEGHIPQPLEATIEDTDSARARRRDAILPVLRSIGSAVAGCGPGVAGANFSRPQAYLLEIFNRMKGLYKACSALLEQDLPEEALIVGQSLFLDAMRLKQASGADEQRRAALAFGWKYDSLEARKGLFQQADSSPEELAEGLAQLTIKQEQLIEAAHQFGANQVETFGDALSTSALLDDSDYSRIHVLAEKMGAGFDIATQSRLRIDESGAVGLHDSAPDSWVLPMATKYIGGCYLEGTKAALKLFGWPDSSELISSESALHEVLEDLT
jgi:hypothetical protein